MKRFVAMLAAAVAVFALTSQSADAHWRHKKVSKPVVATAIGAGVVSTVTYWSILDWSWDKHTTSYKWGAWGATTAGCVALSPIVATALKKAPLTYREAHVLIGSCIVPIVGGWLVNAAYDANPQWEPRTASAKRHKHRHHHKKK
jgi:hypothetical protein